MLGGSSLTIRAHFYFFRIHRAMPKQVFIPLSHTSIAFFVSSAPRPNPQECIWTQTEGGLGHCNVEKEWFLALLSRSPCISAQPLMLIIAAWYFSVFFCFFSPPLNFQRCFLNSVCVLFFCWDLFRMSARKRWLLNVHCVVLGKEF